MNNRASTALATPGGDLDARSDGALVRCARAGDAGATEILFRRHLRPAYRFAFRLLGDERDLDDVVQEAMVAALHDLHKLNDPELFGTWLGRVIINSTSRVLRRRRMLSRLGLMAPGSVDLSGAISPAAAPDTIADLQATYRALLQVPAGMRIALVLRRIEGRGLEEIAELMAISLSTVKRLLSKAEVRFQKALAAKGRSAP
jgi:RNA polymerase sigma-70 factor (ECF subfamily)